MRKTLIVPLVAAAVIGLMLFGCDNEPARVTAPSTESRQAAKPAGMAVGLERAMAVQNQHNPRLMAIPDVVGTAIGLGANSNPAVVVLPRHTA